MQHNEHVLISLEDRHAANILKGTKRVELRRRTMHIQPGSTVWFYVKKPVGAVVGYATTGAIYVASPSSIWRRYGPVSGICRAEYMSYFEGVAQASAMSLSEAKKLKKPVTLEVLRKLIPDFQPPQFYCRLNKNPKIKSYLTKAI